VPPLYSICITNFNTEDSVRQSLESLLNQVDERFEIIIVDNYSDDASLNILRGYDGKQIKLFVKRCSRGLGRQIAFENSSGKYMIGQMDMDDVFKPRLNELVQIYHANFEGYMLETSDTIIVAPRQLVNAIGGYKDLNFVEDHELCSRAAQIGRFRFIDFKIKDCQIKEKKLNRRIRHIIERRYSMLRECFRIGLGTRVIYENFFKVTEVKKNLAGAPLLSLINSLVFPWALINHWFYPQFHNEFFKTFHDENYKVGLNESSTSV